MADNEPVGMATRGATQPHVQIEAHTPEHTAAHTHADTQTKRSLLLCEAPTAVEP